MKRELTKNVTLLKDTWSLWIKELNWLISSAGVLAIQFIGQIFFVIFYAVTLLPAVFMLQDPSEEIFAAGGFIIGLIILYAVAIIFGVYSTLGYTYLSLDMVQTKKAHLENVFKGYKWLGKGLLATLLLILLFIAVLIPVTAIIIGFSMFNNDAVFIVIGVVLLYILMILVFIPFAQVYNVMIDQGKKTMDSIKESIRLMKGAKLKYFGFILIIMLITLIPSLLIFIPMYFIIQGEALIAAGGSLIIISAASMLLMPLLYSFSMTASAKFYYDLKEDNNAIFDSQDTEE